MYDSTTMVEAVLPVDCAAITVRRPASSRTRCVSRLAAPSSWLDHHREFDALDQPVHGRDGRAPRDGRAGRYGQPPVAQGVALRDLVQQPVRHDAVVIGQSQPLGQRRRGGHLGVGVGDDPGGLHGAHRPARLVLGLAGDVDDLPELAQEPDDPGILEPFESTTHAMSHIPRADSESV